MPGSDANDVKAAAGALPEPLPLFPLKAVLFPGGLLPLKVFEARYLDLVARCMRTREPFGVICIERGSEAGRSDKPLALEPVGVLAHIDDVDGEQAGILRLRCSGGQRFRLTGKLEQHDDGLWVSRAQTIDADEKRAPGASMLGSVKALSRAIAALREQALEPFAQPFHLDDAGWVANRWCELLPIPLAAKQKLMALEDPVIRLSLVDAFLRDKQVVGS